MMQKNIVQKSIVQKRIGAPLQPAPFLPNPESTKWSIDNWRWTLLSVGSGSFAVASIGLVLLLIGG